ncbi:uncharacterized protein [Leuresthes tenuis]|uniref:uncharacterized protein n=1 Tax=Leuresthes tenuis TaxID=355514 RepID=UPI003B502B43
MACRRGRQRSRADHSERHIPDNVDQLTFKYMEMCKMESSTDSDSEISPRWSDTSTLGCVSRAPGRGTLRRGVPLTFKSAGRQACYSLFLDPYDGSSEDSEESNTDISVSSRQTRQQSKGGGGGCRLSGRRRRLISHYPASVSLREMVKSGMRDCVIDQQPTSHKDNSDIQMKHGRDCELDALFSNCEWDDQRSIAEEMVTDSTVHMGMELQLNDSGLHSTRSSTPYTPGLQTSVETSSSQMLDSCSERSPSSCNLRSLCKRKEGFPGAEVVELGPRKRQCTVYMEDEPEDKETD